MHREQRKYMKSLQWLHQMPLDDMGITKQIVQQMEMLSYT